MEVYQYIYIFIQELTLQNPETKNYFIKPADYIVALISGDEFYIQFQRFSSEVEAQIIKIIHRYLEQYDLLFHKDTIISIIKELINNAIKANLKRLYFESCDLNINDVKNYRAGMETFKDDVFQAGHEDLISSLDGSKYIVRVTFSSKNNKININVINNIPMLNSELDKIKARVNKAYKYKDMSEAFTDVLDDSEGAGLGLIMALMLLKNSGFPKDSFRISRNENMTSVYLSIPYNVTSPESHFKITEEILKEIEEIPSLPDNVKEIRLLCRNPESTIKDISSAISRDPGLTASIIKLSNSAGYVTMNRIETIEESVKVIGIRGINTLLIATGVQKVVETRYKRFETIWNDSYKRAFYAQSIIKKKNKTMKLGDQVYLAALLSDIGKIVMLSLDLELLNKLKTIAGFKGMADSSLIEEISLGISHSSLGALICKKWNFNESLTRTIELHHRPHRAPAELKTLIYTVYLADAFVEIENSKFRFEISDDDVLQYFNITEKNTFEEFHSSLKDKYSNSVNGHNEVKA